jgi:hypothetical protein
VGVLDQVLVGDRGFTVGALDPDPVGDGGVTVGALVVSAS